MESAEDTREIVICLGSSCFARGNSNHLATIKAHLESHGLEASVKLRGLLCQDQCKVGPNLTVGGELHHSVTSEHLVELLKPLDTLRGRRDGKD